MLFSIFTWIYLNFRISAEYFRFDSTRITCVPILVDLFSIGWFIARKKPSFDVLERRQFSRINTETCSLIIALLLFHTYTPAYTHTHRIHGNAKALILHSCKLWKLVDLWARYYSVLLFIIILSVLTRRHYHYFEIIVICSNNSEHNILEAGSGSSIKHVVISHVFFICKFTGTNKQTDSVVCTLETKNVVQLIVAAHWK